jgi:hypothetical protein
MSEQNLLLSECGYPHLKRSTDSKEAEMKKAMKAAFDKMLHDEINFHILLGNNPLDYALAIFSRGYKAALSQPSCEPVGYFAQLGSGEFIHLIDPQDGTEVTALYAAPPVGIDKYYGFGKRRCDPKPIVGSRWMTRQLGPCTIHAVIKTNYFHTNGDPYYMYELAIDKFPNQVGMFVGQNGLVGNGKRPQDITGFISSASSPSGCEDLRAELKHWKSNHADVVSRLAIATQRPDLPVDRIPAMKEIESLRAENEQLKETKLMLRGLIGEAEDMLKRVISERDTFKNENKGLKEKLESTQKLCDAIKEDRNEFAQTLIKHGISE